MRLALWLSTAALLAGLLVGAAPARAQVGDVPAGVPLGQERPEFEGVGVDAQLGEQVAAEARFVDESGQPVTIGDYLGQDKPVLLTLVYHNCPMLCNLLLDNLVQETLKPMAFTPGEEFDIVTVSFAPDEGPDLAARQKARYVDLLGKEEAADGWHFLTGEEDQIQKLAASVGFQFRWDEETQQYAHPATLIFLAEDGTITRYLFGLTNNPSDARKALVEAGEGKVGTLLDQAVLYCFQFDPSTGGYVASAIRIMPVGGGLTLLVLGLGLYLFWRREHRSLQALETAQA